MSSAATEPTAARSASRPPSGAAPQAGAAPGGTGTALVSSPRLPVDPGSDPEFGALVAKLPVETEVAVPIREFCVRHLLALEPGKIIASQWNHGHDLPLAAGNVKLAWTEFEVIEAKLAVRVTRLA